MAKEMVVLKVPAAAYLLDVNDAASVMRLLCQATVLDTTYENAVGYKIVGNTDRYSRTSMELLTPADIATIHLDTE